MDAGQYSDRRVYIADAQELGYCVMGQRRFWRSLLQEGSKDFLGVTFESFIREGVTVGWLMETGNPYALKLVEHMIGKWNSDEERT